MHLPLELIEFIYEALPISNPALTAKKYFLLCGKKFRRCEPISVRFKHQKRTVNLVAFFHQSYKNVYGEKYINFSVPSSANSESVSSGRELDSNASSESSRNRSDNRACSLMPEETFKDEALEEPLDEDLEQKFFELYGHYNCDELTIAEYAAIKGQLNVLRYIHEEGLKIYSKYVDGYDTIYQNTRYHGYQSFSKNVMDYAAEYGHLDIVKWLQENRKDGCNFYCMDRAAKNGHLDVVKWLHENRTEGCTSDAMDNAASNGHLDVLKWLHENRSEGCTVNAMDGAAAKGNLEVVKWLHEHRSEGCTTRAINEAARYGRLNVLAYLHECQYDGSTSDAMDFSSYGNQVEVIRWLRQHRLETGECCQTGVCKISSPNGS